MFSIKKKSFKLAGEGVQEIPLFSAELFKLPVFNRISLLSLIMVLGLGSVAQPTFAQALIPPALQIDPASLEQQGLGLAQEAAQLAQFQQYKLALPRAELASQLAPRNAQVWALLGSLYLQSERVEKGINALKQANTLDPDNSSVLFALGSAHFQRAKYNEAVQYLQKGLKLKPGVPGALFDLGNAYYMLKRYQDAIVQYETAVKQDGKFWPAINNIGLIKYEQKRDAEALQKWRAAVAIDAKAAEPMLAIAAALYAQGNREQGLAMAESAFKIDSRYGDVKFLKENLWGDRLLGDTRKLLAVPRVQAALSKSRIEQLQRQASESE